MYEGLIIALIVLGIGAILWSFYKDNNGSSIPKKVKLDNGQDHYEEYGARIEELNTKILELNEYSEFMKNEMDKKHKELLFLYQMVHEKSKEIKGQSDTPQSSLENDSSKTIENVTIIEKSSVEKNEQLKMNNNKMILQLSERGYSVKDIAQMLDIGQGEVKLVLDLFE